MTQISFLPGTPDPTLPVFMPSFGMPVSHLYLPENYKDTTWSDSVGTASLSQAGTGKVTKKTENGVSYLHGDGAARFISATLPTTELKTLVFAIRIDAADTANGAAYIFNGGSTGITVTPGEKIVRSVPAATGGAAITLPEFGKWYCVAMVNDGTNPGRVVSETQEVIQGNVVSSSTVRFMGGASSFRETRIALALSSPNAVSNEQLRNAVFPAVRGWLGGLPFGTA